MFLAQFDLRTGDVESWTRMVVLYAPPPFPAFVTHTGGITVFCSRGRSDAAKHGRIASFVCS